MAKLLKADSPIEVTELGICTEANALHPEKNHLSIEVTVSGILNEVKLEHLDIILSPIETELGIFSEVRLMQPWKADSPIEVTELGISIDVKASQSVKAMSPIEVTELGIRIDFKLVHLMKVWSPIEVTELGISIDVKLEQFRKRPGIIEVMVYSDSEIMSYALEGIIRSPEASYRWPK